MLDAEHSWCVGITIAVIPRHLATRAGICDMGALRRRVLADELSLAADVFDIEPLPLDDPLLGRHNVVHTPHNAGRTKESAAWPNDPPLGACPDVHQPRLTRRLFGKPGVIFRPLLAYGA